MIDMASVYAERFKQNPQMLQAAVMSMRGALGAQRARVQLFDQPSTPQGNGQEGTGEPADDVLGLQADGQEGPEGLIE